MKRVWIAPVEIVDIDVKASPILVQRSRATFRQGRRGVGRTTWKEKVGYTIHLEVKVRVNEPAGKYTSIRVHMLGSPWEKSVRARTAGAYKTLKFSFRTDLKGSRYRNLDEDEVQAMAWAELFG